MKIKTKIGLFHLHHNENNILQVCDSDDEFIGNLYGDTKSNLKYFFDNIFEFDHITQLCDILTDNMTYGSTKRSAAIAALEYIQEEKFNWDGEEWEYTEEDIQTFEEYANRVGDTYFIVDYTDI